MGIDEEIEDSGWIIVQCIGNLRSMEIDEEIVYAIYYKYETVETSVQGLMQSYLLIGEEPWKGSSLLFGGQKNLSGHSQSI